LSKKAFGGSGNRSRKENLFKKTYNAIEKQKLKKRRNNGNKIKLS
jgi:hypothetical protein